MLKGINLGKRTLIKADLLAAAEAAGFSDAKTLLASGNLVFEADEVRPHEVEERLEEAFEEKFGKHVDIIVRSECTWMALCSANPFKDGKGNQVIVRVNRLPIDPQKVEALKPLLSEGQRMELIGCDLWIDFHGKPSQSKLLSALSTKRMGVGTLRNWNTVRGLFEMVV